ncbi:MAG TPA: dienelactone hydrolase family protein [Thermoanaerobaculia bacterium]|nr:dienelactone hydrolase family protein [Thermoanaerobaculia bacterium]
MKFLLALASLFLASCATAPQPPAAIDPAQRLELSPRHHEWITIESNGRQLHAYLAFSERSSLSPAVLVIHENRGLDDWARSVADQLAERGFIAIAPDMLSGAAPGGGRSSDFATDDARREAIGKLQSASVLADLRAAADYVRNLPSTNDRFYTAGFCWGGARVWQLANAYDGITASFVFYGTGPQEPEGVSGIDAPVYGLYGGADARVNATIDRTAEVMRAAGKTFEPTIYDGAGHAFMRLGETTEASAANRRARDEAWSRWLGLMMR